MVFRPPGDCPVCGALVPPRAHACPECGADDRSGWREDDAGSGLDLPDDGFDYDSFIREEFGAGPAPPRGIHPIWWITGILLAVMLAMALLRCW